MEYRRDNNAFPNDLKKTYTDLLGHPSLLPAVDYQSQRRLLHDLITDLNRPKKPQDPE